MLTIIVGGQFGGEGKGKVCAYLAKNQVFGAISRCGGVNSSHTIVEGERTHRLRLLPAASAVSRPQRIIFGAGTLLHLPTLFAEIEALNVDRSTIMIDPQAGIITEECVETQRMDKRYGSLGSTLTGTGYASAWRCMRALPLAQDFPELKSMIGGVAEALTGILGRPRNNGVLVEGHQAFGLSNYHGDYPFTSSRDCTAAAMLSELGIGPRAAKLRIILVVKCFPTRNHGGQLDNEISSEEADKLGILEYGGGSWGISDNRRRVGIVDFDIIARAARANSATEVVLTGADYLDRNIRGSADPTKLSGEVLQFIDTVEKAAGVRVSLVSTGPETDAMINLAPKHRSGKRASVDERQADLLQ